MKNSYKMTLLLILLALLVIAATGCVSIPIPSRIPIPNNIPILGALI